MDSSTGRRRSVRAVPFTGGSRSAAVGGNVSNSGDLACALTPMPVPSALNWFAEDVWRA